MLGALLVLGTLSAACGTGAGAGHAPRGLARGSARATTTTTTRATTTTTTTTAPPAVTTTTLPTFTSSESAVTAAELGGTYHAGCPVGPSQLTEITMTYWGFDGAAHTGNMVVNTSVVPAVVQVFSTLYADRFPLAEMVPESAYDGNDNAAAAADDTSGFNCRFAVAPGPPQWSVHAYGEAIDVNDVQNPYVDGSNVIPPAGVAYETRADVRPGMAEPGGTLVEAFTSVGWYWGGLFTGAVDYQHFSLTGH